MQVIRVAPGATVPVAKCGSNSNDKYVASRYTAEASPPYAPWVTVDATQFIVVGASADAALNSEDELTLKITSASDNKVDMVPVKVIVTQISIEPDSGVSKADDGSLKGPPNAPFSLQAKVYGALDVSSFEWTWAEVTAVFDSNGVETEREIAGTRQRLVTDSRASFMLPQGRYSVAVSFEGPRGTVESAPVAVYVSDGDWFASLSDYTRCPDALRLDCGVLPNGEPTTGAIQICAQVNITWVGDADAPAVAPAYAFEATSSDSSVPFDRSRRPLVTSANQVTFCHYSSEAVSLTGRVTINAHSYSSARTYR